MGHESFSDFVKENKEKIHSICDTDKAIKKDDPWRNEEWLLSDEPLCKQCKNMYAYDTSTHQDYCDDCYKSLPQAPDPTATAQ